MSRELSDQAAVEIARLASDIYYAREVEPNDPGYCLFIGSGCSLPAAPSSSKLTEKLVEEFYGKIPSNERKSRFEREFPSYVGEGHITLEAICEAYKEMRGPDALLRSLKAKFGQRGKFHEGYAVLGDLVKEGYFKAIFTTNIDTLIEDTFKKKELDFDLIEDLSDYQSRTPSTSAARPCVYKLHGSYDHPDPNVSDRDLQQLHPAKSRHLQFFFELNSFIFVGYSARDMDIFFSLSKVETFVRERLRMYSFTLSGDSPDMKKLLRRYNSIRGNIALGNVDNGGTLLFALKNEIKNVEEKAKK